MRLYFLRAGLHSAVAGGAGRNRGCRGSGDVMRPRQFPGAGRAGALGLGGRRARDSLYNVTYCQMPGSSSTPLPPGRITDWALEEHLRGTAPRFPVPVPSRHHPALCSRPWPVRVVPGCSQSRRRPVTRSLPMRPHHLQGARPRRRVGGGTAVRRRRGRVHRQGQPTPCGAWKLGEASGVCACGRRRQLRGRRRPRPLHAAARKPRPAQISFSFRGLSAPASKKINVNALLPAAVAVSAAAVRQDADHRIL
jgi:hypothetical protein